MRQRMESQKSMIGLDLDAGGRWADVWLYEDRSIPLDSAHVAVSTDRDTFRPGPVTFDDMRPGCYEAKSRLVDMDRNHTIASLCFPTFPRFCGQTFLEGADKDLALLCVKAFNDWMIQEWNSASGGRLLPLMLIPLWDSRLAAEEVRRGAAKGARAVAFSELPTRLGLPSIHDKDRYWDPLFATCEETKTALCMHIGSSSQVPTTSPDAPPSVSVSLVSNNSVLSLVDFLWSGVLERFPELNLVYAESQVGWIPYVLERCDKIWNADRKTSARGRTYHDFYGMTSPEAPSYYYHRQVFGCLFDDEHGLRSISDVGEDNVLFEVDYPHIDSTWPHTDLIVKEIEAVLLPDQLDKLFFENAANLFGLPSTLIDQVVGAAGMEL